MPLPTSLRRVALAALALFATTASPAQGLGGVLNKAKAKMGQATPSPAQAATQAAQGSAGELPYESPDLTLESQESYARAVMANRRPLVLSQNTGAPDYFYQVLTKHFQLPLRFSWDAAALKFLTDKNRSLWSGCEDVSTDLGRTCLSGNTAPALKASLRKVKEIRFTTTQALPTSEEDKEFGYIKSFNPTTGVLTAAISVGPGANAIFPAGVGNSSHFSNWIVKHVK